MWAGSRWNGKVNEEDNKEGKSPFFLTHLLQSSEFPP